MKRLGITLSVAALIMLAGCSKAQEAEASVAQEEEPIKVESIEADGEVAVPTCNEISLGFEATIKEVKVKDGQIVHKGDVLAVFENQDYLNAIEEQKQNISIKQAEIEKLNVTINPLSVQIQGIESELSVVQEYINKGNNPQIDVLKSKSQVITEKLKKLNSDYAMKKELQDAGAASNSELEELQTEIKSLEEEQKSISRQIDQINSEQKVQADKLQSQINSLQTQISNEDKSVASNLKILNEELKLYQMKLKEMENKLNASCIKGNTIVATEDTMLIYEVNAINGTHISANQSLLKAMNMSMINVELDVPIEDINAVEVGDEVRVRNYADKTIEILGKVTEISNRVTEVEGDKVVRVNVEVTENKEQLRVGEEVEADIYTK